MAVEVFEGSTADPMTLASQVAKIRERFGLQQVVLVGDRGMLTAARIREDLAGVEGLRWITTLRAPTIRKLVNAGTVTASLFDEHDLAEITSDEFPGERLIVCRNPLLAAERQRKRDELLAATEKELEPVVAATSRNNQPLRGAADIGLRVGKVINRYKMAKHFVTDITDERFTYRRNDEKIAAEEQLDGIYIVRSNVEPERFDAAQTVRAYKDLSKVERAFRSLKSVDLKVRPLHHRRADRVRAHVLLCKLAYYVEWHMRRALAPLLFDDHDPAAAEQPRASVVAPARRSPGAVAKARRKRTDDGLPVHSFRTLLTDLGTLTANTMQVAGSDAPSRCRHSQRRSSSAASKSWGDPDNVATNSTPRNQATTTTTRVTYTRSAPKLRYRFPFSSGERRRGTSSRGSSRSTEGFRGVGDFDGESDWRNPVAMILRSAGRIALERMAGSEMPPEPHTRSLLFQPRLPPRELLISELFKTQRAC